MSGEDAVVSSPVMIGAVVCGAVVSGAGPEGCCEGRFIPKRTRITTTPIIQNFFISVPPFIFIFVLAYQTGGCYHSPVYDIT
jgi:hypothetical protein